MRFSAGTRQSSKNSSAVSLAFRPTFSSRRPRVKPGVPRSTAIRLTPCAPWSVAVFATTITRSAFSPLVMNVFCPLSTYVVAVADRRRPYPGQVGPGARLAHRDRRDQVAAAEAGQPPLALVLGGEVGEVRRDDVVVQAEAQARAAGPDDLLDEHRVEPEVALAAAAVRVVDVRTKQPGRARLAPHRAVDQAGLLPRRMVRHGLAGKEFAA